MYWQFYFHPVSRSAEVILTKILHRAKHLFESGYEFKQKPAHFQTFFDKTLVLEDYIALDEGVMTTYFQMWTKESDSILADLSTRFLNRRLFQYVEFNPAVEYEKMHEIKELFIEAGIDPEYYLVVDSSSDLPYDFYRPGEENERLPIFLKLPNGELSEISRSSDIVDAISGKRRTDHKLYFPEDLLEAGKAENPLYHKILKMLKN
jgi:uncharacterized protein